jgi:hypothetical protein
MDRQSVREAAQARAKDQVPGNVFHDAFSSATLAGFPIGHEFHIAYIFAYIEALNDAYPHGILVDAEGYITEEPSPLLVAFNAGVARARTLTPGDRFLGAAPEALAAGYPPSFAFGEARLRHSLFVSGFLLELKRRWPEGVKVDRNQVIKE